jgi:hypothetical protein
MDRQAAGDEIALKMTTFIDRFVASEIKLQAMKELSELCRAVGHFAIQVSGEVVDALKEDLDADRP